MIWCYYCMFCTCWSSYTLTCHKAIEERGGEVISQLPTSSLNSFPQAGFRLISSTKMSNLWLVPPPILLRAATALNALLCNSAARSRSCLTVSFVTTAPFIVFSNNGVASSKWCATAAGATWARRKSIIWQMTLISSESSERPGTTRTRKSCKLSFPRHVSSYKLTMVIMSGTHPSLPLRTKVYIVS